MLPEKCKFGDKSLRFEDGTFVRLQDLTFYRTGFVGLGDVVMRSELENKQMTGAQLLEKLGVKPSFLERSKWTEPEEDDENEDLIAVKNAENSKK